MNDRPLHAIDPLLQVEAVSRSHEQGRVQALVDVSFSADAGQTLALTGPSGGGKSSLLSLIGLLDRPTRGRVCIGGQDLVQFGIPLFAEVKFDGQGFGLGFSVLQDPMAAGTLGTAGEFGWGGAASTAFWVDPKEEITAIFMTQLLPSSTWPIRTQLRQLVYSALVD